MIKNKNLLALAIFIIAFIVLIIIWINNSRSNETINIGAILPLTGKGDYIGEEWKNGIILAVDKINSRGGINGKKLNGEFCFCV